MYERGTEYIKHTWHDGKGDTEDVTAKVRIMANKLIQAHGMTCTHCSATQTKYCKEHSTPVNVYNVECCDCPGCTLAREILKG